ncbi:hypothetical protein B0H13DRAFT_2676767 [Mycena leptocephala]|nr:hypothetical protein B0H13DRAFT_2676767 [Mycena leptocephala]
MLAALEADRARVADLKAQISHLERSLSALHLGITKRNRIRRLHALRITLSLAPPLIGLLSPTLLTQICRKWREIALGTPSLWSALTTYHGGINIPFDLVIHAFDIWLNRSRCCPVSLQFDATDSQMDVAEFLAILVPHRARWESLCIYLSPSHLPLLDGPMPLLRYLDLRLDSSTDTKAVTFEVPLLHSVVLNDDAALSVILPWAQLTSLNLLCVYPHDCVPILQQTSSLVRCKLELFDPYSNRPGPDITLPCLESLTLDQGRESVIGFLETLIVPALRSLEIPEQFLEPNPIELLAAFISKSGCKLEEVEITGPRAVPESSYLKAFPSIPRFLFTNEESSDESDSSDVEGDLDSE